MRACRRALIAGGGRPLKTRDLLHWAFPGVERRFWHYKSIYRAAPRYAVKVDGVWMPRSDGGFALPSEGHSEGTF
jgi:hypothetical protein